MAVKLPLLTILQAPIDGVNEVQSVALTGSPDGGSFTLALDLTLFGRTSEESGAIAYNATAAAVQTALEAMDNISAGEVVCAGGPLPGSAVTVTYQNALGGLNLPSLVGDGTSLTGGVAPDVDVTVTTPGVKGTYRGCANGQILADETNGDLYMNNGDEYVPEWGTDFGTMLR